jgi:hypothetical protein
LTCLLDDSCVHEIAKGVPHTNLHTVLVLHFDQFGVLLRKV